MRKVEDLGVAADCPGAVCEQAALHANVAHAERLGAAAYDVAAFGYVELDRLVADAVGIENVILEGTVFDFKFVDSRDLHNVSIFHIEHIGAHHCNVGSVSDFYHRIAGGAAVEGAALNSDV